MGLIGLCDCNNFYASCERVFEPRLRGKAVVVLSNNDGCVVARSNEAKALGIAMGAPWHLNKATFAKAGVVVKSSNYALYGDLSRRVMAVLGEFTPRLEIYSIDEAFLDLDGFGDRLVSHLSRLRQQVLAWTGIPVSVGVAPTKTLAKLANRIAKKGAGIHVLETADAKRLALRGIPLTDLWGISTRLERRLNALGITDGLDLADADPAILRKHLGVVVERLALELNGIACHQLELVGASRKSIAATRSFGRSLTEGPAVAGAVSSYVERAAGKLRTQGLAANAVLVFVHTNPFKPTERQYSASQVVTLPVASADTGKLVAAALRGLRVIWRRGYAYKKAGIVLLDLIPAGNVQGDLFTSPDSARRITLMRTVDSLNARLGSGAVRLASSGVSEPWAMRADKRSPRYTTVWQELLVVRR